MHEPHPSFKEPETLTLKLWRYIDLAKFIDLLRTSSLFFCRSDKLGDPFEGVQPKPTLPRMEAMLRDEGMEESELQKILRTFSSLGKEWRRFVAINCWHANEYESAAMWKLYATSLSGIAITTTYADLKASFIGEEKVFVGLVRYIDYDTGGIVVGNLLSPFSFKRKSFEHEREVRALVYREPDKHEIPPGKWADKIVGGVHVKVDVFRLIQGVYVAPDVPEWYFDVVKSVCEKFGLEKPLHKSSLLEDPYSDLL